MESKKKPSPIDIARNHIARVAGATNEIIGADDEDLRSRRMKFIDETNILDAGSREAVRANLLQRIERLEKSGMGGTSELRWKLTIIGSE